MVETIEVHEPAAAFVRPSPDALIRCEGLEKWYGGVQALKGVDFHAERAEVGLVGDNGAGKSTLIKLLSGAHQPDAGRIFIEGREVRLASPSVAMSLGIETIYQSAAMVPQMSVARNIFIGREPLRVSIGGIGLMDRRRMAEQAISSMTNIDLRARSPETPVDELRRPAPGCSHRPRHVLQIQGPDPGRADQSSLDQGDQQGPGSRASLREQGITSIFISHNLHHVYPIADRIVAMARGEKIADLRKTDTSIEALTDLIV